MRNFPKKDALMGKDSKVFVISGPSGVGKGTLVRELLARVPHLYLSVSATTRPPRFQEKPGVNYFFLSEEEFFKKVRQGKFLEWAQVYHYYYGTFYSQLRQGFSKGFDVVLELDLQGARQVKKKLSHSILIFIAPPSLFELKRRLKGRSPKWTEDLEFRLKKAEQEMEHVCDFDYKVVNDRVQRALQELVKIVENEREEK